MRFNDVTVLALVLLLGVLLGVLLTLGVYGPVAARQAEGERQEVEEALKRAQQDRDEALARIDATLAAEHEKSWSPEQGGSEDAPPLLAGAVAAPKPAVPAAPAQATSPPPGTEEQPRAQEAATDAPADNPPPRANVFGPPRTFPPK